MHPILGDPCPPDPSTAEPNFRLLRWVIEAPHKAARWIARTSRQFARPIRMFVYGTAGVLVGSVALLLGVGPADAASFGTNTTTTLLSVWALPPGRRKNAMKPPAAEQIVPFIPRQASSLRTSDQRRLARGAHRFQERCHAESRLATAADRAGV
ncbi:hypothetical protein ABZS68_38700 [Streptomyces sp. NPDC005571]|uniref:hypothetical protein n=1 Tax=Streptomyces sp. NPDC005571 TaxID=3156888 RepID=UPI0033B3D9F4